MATAHVTIEAVARALEVDPKTVQRWLAGRTPRPRHRWALADLVNTNDESLWPGANLKTANSTSPTSEIVSAYAHRADVPRSLWSSLLHRAYRQVDLLAYAMLFLPEQHPELIDLLAVKAADGCRIRVLLGDPESMQVAELDREEGFDGAFLGRVRSSLFLFRELPALDSIGLRLHCAPLYSSIYRFDDDMLVNPHLYGNHAYKSPVYHFRRLATNGIFDNYAKSVDRLWEAAFNARELKH